MRIRNETRLDTRQLKTLLLEVARREQWSTNYRKRLAVYVHPRRANGRLWGRAPYGSHDVPWASFRLFLREGDDTRQIARTAAHEAAHNHGLTHRQMPDSYFWGKVPDVWEWAAAYRLETRPESKGRPTPGADAKLLHAQGMLARAETRAKRAATLLRRWKVRTRYYQRKFAASKVPE